jgi:phosphatidate cytidylyltransferase
MKRVLSAVVFLPLFWIIVKKLDPAFFHVLMVAGALVSLIELYRMAEAHGHRPHRWVGGAITLLFLASFVAGGVGTEYPLLLSLFALPVASLRRGGDWRKGLGDIGATLFIACFIGVLFGYVLGLRELEPSSHGKETGGDLVFLLFFVVWGSDTAAYYVGTALGRRPLAPTVSPKKTVEGAVAGILGALAAAFVSRAWFIHRLSVIDCLALGIVLATVAILGDLVESMLKRGAGMKDSASLVPGHGGILDRVDSLLYAAPVLYYYYLLVMRA